MNKHYTVITEGTLYIEKGSQKYKIQSLKSGLYKLINITYDSLNTNGIKYALKELEIFFNKLIIFPINAVKSKSI